MTAKLQIQFRGVDEGGDPKNMPPGTMIRALNYQMDKARRLIKRRGTIGLVKTTLSGSSPAAGVRLLTQGTAAALTDGQTAWTYAESLSKWGPIDRPPCWRVTKRVLADSTRSVSAIDIAIYGNLLISLFTTGGATGLFYQVDDLTTGEAIVPPTVLIVAGFVAAIGRPRILVSGTSAYLFASEQGGTVSVNVLDLTTLVAGGLTSLFVNATAAPTVYDVAIGTPTAGVPTLYVIYELAAGASRTRIASFTLSTLAAVATIDKPGTTLLSAAVAFCPLSQAVAAMWSSVASVDTSIMTTTTALVSPVGPTSVSAVMANAVFVAEDDATNVLAGWTNDYLVTDADRLTTALYSIAGTTIVLASRRLTYGLYIASAPWKTAGRWFVSAMTFVHPYVSATDKIAQPSTVVMEIETAASLTGVQDSTHPHVATLENQTGWTASAAPTPVADASGRMWIASPYRTREPDNYTTAIPFGWSLFRLAASAEDTFRPAVLGAASLLAGGAPAWFDGASAMPYGFSHAPQIVSVTATAGGAAAAGTYSYVATYAWRDANGVLHRSAPSAPKTGTTAAANLTMAVKVATSSVSAKQRTLSAAQSANPVFIELWRTDGIAGTGPHYRLSLEPTYQVLVNDPQVGDVTLSDGKAAANIASGAPAITLASQAQLYTDLGELPNLPPPSLITVTTHRGRLAGIGPDLRTVWLTKDSTLDATLAPGFNEALTLAFAHDKTALASLDAVLVVFGESTIDVIQGDGPDDRGDANTWQIQAVQTDVGCTNPRSVAVAPMGCLFLSRRGLELLDRGLNVTWIGLSVDDTLTAYPNVTSAVLVSELGEVRWTCDNGTNGIVLVLDYLNKCWFTRTYADPLATNLPAVRFVDAALINGVYTLLTATGQVYRETALSSLDGMGHYNQTYVETDVLLAPISAQPGRAGWSNDNLAWQRVKDLTVMGTSVADHDLEISFARDYATTFEQVHTFRAGSDVCAPGPLEKARVTVAVQKCQAIQIRIRDLKPTGYAISNASAGPILEALALRVGAKDGPAKTSAGQQA